MHAKYYIAKHVFGPQYTCIICETYQSKCLKKLENFEGRWYSSWAIPCEYIIIYSWSLLLKGSRHTIIKDQRYHITRYSLNWPGQDTFDKNILPNLKICNLLLWQLGDWYKYEDCMRYPKAWHAIFLTYEPGYKTSCPFFMGLSYYWHHVVFNFLLKLVHQET